MFYGMTKAEKKRATDTLLETVKVIERIPTDSRCVRCDHHSVGHYCDKWGKRIPEDWLEKGCDAWEEGIPF